MLFDSNLATSRITSPDNLMNMFQSVVRVAAVESNDDLSALESLDTPVKTIKKEYDNSNRFGAVSDRENIHVILEDGRREIGKDREFTTAERALGAALGKVDTEANVARVLGASVPTIAKWKTGKTTHGGQVRPELVDKTKQQLGKIRDVAMEKLLITLGLIDDDKLETLGAKDLSIVASNVSKVVERALPKDEASMNRTQIIMYSPQQMNIAEYNVVEA